MEVGVLFRILLVDDELFFRQGLRAIMDWNACGYEVIGEQDNGEDAYHFIVEHQPDVVITDIRMPECDGLELIYKVVYEAKLKTKFIIVSGYDEFKYAQQAVKYGVCDFLLKPVDELNLEQTLHEIAKKLQAEQEQARQSTTFQNVELLEEILYNEPTDEQLMFYYESMKLDMSEAYYCIHIEHHQSRYGKRSDNQHTEQLQHDLNVLAHSFPHMDQQHIFQLQGKLVVLIEHAWLTPYMSYTTLLRQLQKKLQQHEDQVHLYASQACTGIHFLKEAYNGADYAYQFKYYDEREIFDYDEFASKSLRHIMLPAENYKMLLQELESNHPEQLQLEMEQLFKQFQQECCSIEAIRTSLHKLVADCLHILQVMQIDKARIPQLQPMLSWDYVNTSLKQLKSLTLNFLIACSSCIAEERQEMAKGGIQRIKKYIDHHYSEQMNLKSIAAHFYINSVYLGQLFKKTYGVYFNDYLLQLRIQEAKKMLRQTDMRIYEIAEKVGFSHPEYFVSQFEKTEKLSPTAYRQTFQTIVGE